MLRQPLKHNNYIIFWIAPISKNGILVFAHQRETLMLELEEEQMLRESAEQELQKLAMESDKIRGQHRALQEEYKK